MTSACATSAPRRGKRARPITYEVTDRGCWVVTSHKPTTGGYVSAWVDGRTQLLHRWSLEKSLGRPITSGLLSIHSCDNPPCINPDHLREGTHADNNRDMWERGRARVRTADRSRFFQTRRSDLYDQLKRCSVRSHQIAAELQMSDSRIRDILNGDADPGEQFDLRFQIAFVESGIRNYLWSQECFPGTWPEADALIAELTETANRLRSQYTGPDTFRRKIGGAA